MLPGTLAIVRGPLRDDRRQKAVCELVEGVEVEYPETVQDARYAMSLSCVCVQPLCLEPYRRCNVQQPGFSSSVSRPNRYVLAPESLIAGSF